MEFPDRLIKENNNDEKENFNSKHKSNMAPKDTKDR